ncbi:MAG: hypothetical protein NC093_11330 [Alistipes sp.]|nr:hypothetical protein [Alistipes sp.]
MTKLGQAEFAEFLAEMFVKDKLDKMLENSEKQHFSSRNTEDIYKKFCPQRMRYRRILCWDFL